MTPLLIALAAMVSAPADAPGDARIAFPTRGGIVRMQADGDEALYVQDYSTIVVGDERCQIQSLTRSGPPPSKRSRRAGR
jgi:hypothetical protein